MTPITILIVDDHAVVRQKMRRMVSIEPAIQIVGEANGGREAVCQAKSLFPDLILMDLVMPPEDGLEAIAAIKQDHPQIKIIAMTTFLDDIRSTEALIAGADGCLLKDGDREALLQAIHVVHQGGRLPHPRFARQLAKSKSSVI
jgi:DNA-binding NarL/FixJ family response regulator